MSFPLGRRYVTKTLMVSEPLKTVLKLWRREACLGRLRLVPVTFKKKKFVRNIAGRDVKLDDPCQMYGRSMNCEYAMWLPTPCCSFIWYLPTRCRSFIWCLPTCCHTCSMPCPSMYIRTKQKTVLPFSFTFWKYRLLETKVKRQIGRGWIMDHRWWGTQK